MRNPKKLPTMKTETNPVRETILMLGRSISAQLEMSFARKSGRAVSLRTVLDLLEYLNSSLSAGENDPAAEELENWLSAEVRCDAPEPEQEEITPRRVAWWLADQAGSDWKRRTKILRAFKAVRQAWPES